MRALYCTDTYPPQVNGVSVVTHLSVEGLRARGWRVGVIGPRYPAGPNVFGDGSDPDLVSLPSLACPGYREIRLVAPRMAVVAEAARRLQPDLVHCATEGVTGWLGQRIARQLGIPIVTSYHTNFGRYMGSYGLGWLEAPVTRHLTRFHQRANRTLTPSRATQRELIERGIDRVTVWGCGVDATTFRPEHRSAEVRSPLARDDQFLFLHVGRLAPEKSVDRIVAGFARCREALGDRVRLVIAGDGPSRADLERTAPDGVTFLGYLDRAALLPQLYASADGFVFASETETLGLVILEAMASGLPVVAAPAGGVADHLRHGVNGLAYPAGDVEMMARWMIDLATERPLHEALADGARETAVALTWEKELDRLDSCYRDILRSHAEVPARVDPPSVVSSAT